MEDTPYQQDSILVTYATNPERALTLLEAERSHIVSLAVADVAAAIREVAAIAQVENPLIEVEK